MVTTNLTYQMPFVAQIAVKIVTYCLQIVLYVASLTKPWLTTPANCAQSSAITVNYATMVPASHASEDIYLSMPLSANCLAKLGVTDATISTSVYANNVTVK